MNMKMVDLCVQWITERNAVYLAKEDIITYYTSDTGLKSDYRWVKLSMAEAKRIIHVTLLDGVVQMDSSHLLRALQEESRVYEYGVSTPRETKPTVFNYMLNSDTSMADTAAQMVAEEFLSSNFTAVYYTDVRSVLVQVGGRLDLKLNTKDVSHLLHKHMANSGYVMRTGVNRPVVKGMKVSACMLPGTLPGQIVELGSDATRNMAIKIHGALK